MTISYSDWQSYAWKNELRVQLDRVLVHCGEIINNKVAGDHNPLDMLERALALAAFSIRRLIEKRLVTDLFASRKLRVRTFSVVGNNLFRTPFLRESGGDLYNNYQLKEPAFVEMKPKWIGDEIIHSSQLMTIYGDAGIADGLLIASDHRMKKRILHFPLAEFADFANAALSDLVGIATDQRIDDGTVTAIRS